MAAPVVRVIFSDTSVTDSDIVPVSPSISSATERIDSDTLCCDRKAPPAEAVVLCWLPVSSA